MAIKIIPLAKAYPGSGYDSHTAKSTMFAHAGREHWEACHILHDKMKSESTFLVHVWLPLMHMAMELFIKAFPAFFDHKFDSKKYGHNISKIITKYSNQIDTLKLIENDSMKMELIKGLERSWGSVRYFESVISCEGRDWGTFNDIIMLLFAEYKRVTGYRI